MPMIKYTDTRLSAKTRATIKTANEIIAEYAKQGYDLTLRQLYYQFVSRDLIKNNLKAYKVLGEAINTGRLAGLIDWDAITDRTRNLRGLSHWDSPTGILESSASFFRVDNWSRQFTRKEVWIEKDALIGVLQGVCNELDVPYFSCRGYTSQSEMWAAAQRLRRWEKGGQDTIVLHLGDHDPSGIDMTRDITERLKLFGAATTVKRIALNMDQVEEYGPPPNPAKMTDSRAEEYVKLYGEESWELDALEPAVITELIRKHVLDGRDEVAWKVAVGEEVDGKALLKACVKDWKWVSAQLVKRGQLE